MLHLDAATRPPRRPWPHAVTRRSLSICSSGCSWRRPDDAVEEEGLPSSTELRGSAASAHSCWCRVSPWGLQIGGSMPWLVARGLARDGRDLPMLEGEHGKPRGGE
jgi:hypothetical protein